MAVDNILYIHFQVNASLCFSFFLAIWAFWVLLVLALGAVYLVGKYLGQGETIFACPRM